MYKELMNVVGMVSSPRTDAVSDFEEFWDAFKS